ncbi:ABC transporter permease [Pandoraea sp. NPDC087047]|uniref:ABC transporter permease n=1 Tax=Pandoraea sp. NPDC087047 TaxID=3364390 RepID=UPI0037F6B6C8
MRTGLEVMRASVSALFLRELRTRFGKYRLLYFWAPIEPVAHVLLFMAIFGVISHRSMPDISFPAFLVNGVLPWFLFSGIALRSLSAVEANKGLFNYRPVKPIDTLLARALLECLIYGSVYCLILAGLAVFGEQVSIDHVPALLMVWALLAAFSAGIGLMLMVVGASFGEAEKIVPLVLKPLYFASGVMFSINVVPIEYRQYLLWNPLLHAIELARHAAFPDYPADDVSLAYLAFAALASCAFGLALYRGRESAMLTS